MHFLTYVFIPADGDIEAAVAEMLRPFEEDFPVQPWKRYLGTGEVTAMCQQFGLPRRARLKLASRMEDWTGRSGGVDEEGLFEIATENPDTRWDWYEVGGRWDGHLPGNVTAAAELRRSPRLEALLPHDFLTPDGTWRARASVRPWNWPARVTELPERTWAGLLRAALETYPESRVVVVDRHV